MRQRLQQQRIATLRSNCRWGSVWERGLEREEVAQTLSIVGFRETATGLTDVYSD